MEGGEGMVAVVRGLKDSGLTVTLIDGNKQYTLMPNAAAAPDLTHHVASQNGQEASLPSRCDSGAQATDDRYATVYKLAHCRISPTSPTVQLTEFPPQRVELCKGQGHFEVGGCGSGESYTPCKSNGSVRGGLSWPDRGSVCSARSYRETREPDAFANSLRKYPNLSSDRSAEMVEKLITYTQAKNLSKSYQSRNSSPTRQDIESNASYQIRYANRNSQKSNVYQKNEEYDVKLPSYASNSMDESPTREGRPRSDIECDCTDYRRLKSPDVKCLREVSRKVRENLRSMSSFPYNQAAVCPTVNERYEMQAFNQRDCPILMTTNSVNMEVQVAAEMVSKEVATVPRTQPLQRNVAVSLSPAISSTNQKGQGEVSVQVASHEPNIHKSYKYVQTAIKCEDLSVQATSSSFELAKSKKNCLSFVIERRSKSEDKLTIHKDLKDEILELLERVYVWPTANPTASHIRRKILKRMSAKLQKLSHNLKGVDDGENAKVKVGNMLKYVPVWISCGNVEAFRDAISNEIIGKIRHFNTINEVYRAEVTPIQIDTESSLNNILRNWVKSLPINTSSFGMLTDKIQIINKYKNRIQRIVLCNLNDDRFDELHTDLFNLTYKIPMNVESCHKIDYLNQLIACLISKVRNIRDQKGIMIQSNTSSNVKSKTIDKSLKRYVQPTENELRELIENELGTFFHRIHFSIDDHSKQYIETELIDIFMDSMEAIRHGKDNGVIEETVLLLQEISGVTRNQATNFAKKLLGDMKEVFSNKDTSRDFCLPVNDKQNNVVLQNTSVVFTQLNRSCNMNNNEQGSIGETAKSDKDIKMNIYLDQLSQQIDEWLQSSQINIPHSHDNGFRQIVIHDLAGDIIDRRKYLDLNPLKHGSNEDELEHLKYQIFKWINKLIGEENKETLERAPELMKRIQSISLPTVSKQQSTGLGVSSGGGMQNCSRPDNNNYIRRDSNNPSIQNMSNININRSKSNLRERFSQFLPQPNSLQPSCRSESQTLHSGPSIRLLNDDYDSFIKNWVKEIPMPSSTSQEQAMAEKARQGIYNGVWQIITKLKFDPEIFHNVFYYEDALDEELEELLKYLPDTTEMRTKKHLLKVKLIEKTTNTNEMIRISSAPSSFRQQLVDNVAQNLPTNNKSVNKSNALNKTFENEQIQKLVDDYILCAKFKESDKLKADVYRMKLIQKAQSLIENIKNTHGKELREIDTDLYINSILKALHKVPLPKPEILDEEANEIQVGQEVDQWFADLQYVRRDGPADQQQTIKLKNALVKRIIELDKDLNISDCSGERALKHEVSLFLERMPMQVRSANIDYMAEEFTNRLKNRAKEFQTDNEGKKTVAFLDSVGYYEFSVQMPGCSSFSEMPLRPALYDQSSIMMRDGNIVPKGSPCYLQFQPPISGSSLEAKTPPFEYISIEDSRAPKKLPTFKPMQNQQFEQLGGSPNVMLPGNQLNSYGQFASNVGQLTGAQYQQATQGLSPANQLAIQNQAPMYSMARDNRSLVQGLPYVMPQISSQAIHDQRNSQEPIAPVHRLYYETSNVITNMPADQGHPAYGSRNEQQMISRIPNQIPPCCVNNGQIFEEANRVVNPTRFLSTAYLRPGANVNQKIPIAIGSRNEQSMMANVPAQAPSCCARNGHIQETTSVVSPTRQRLSASMSPAYAEHMSNVSQIIPIVIQAPETYQESHRPSHLAHHTSERILHQQQTTTENKNVPGSVTTYGQPQGFSTPQSQVITQVSPPRPDRKKSRRLKRSQQNIARRRLDLEDDSDDASETDGPCPCIKRMLTSKCRRRPMCYDYEDFEMDGPECYPHPYSCPYFY